MIKKTLEEKIDQISLDIKNIQLSFRAQRNLLTSEILQRNSKPDQQIMENTISSLIETALKQNINSPNLLSHKHDETVIYPSTSFSGLDDISKKDFPIAGKPVYGNSRYSHQIPNNDRDDSFHEAETTPTINEEKHEVDEINAIEDEIVLALKRLEEIKPVTRSFNGEQ